MSLLFSKIKIGTQIFKNRLVMSPMCQYSSIDGFANDWHLVHLGSRAVGGVGLIMQEATAVSPIGRISPDDLGLWKDEHMSELEKIVHFVHHQDSKIGIQLAHAGRKSSTSSIWRGSQVLDVEQGGWEGIAPSAIPFDATFHTPQEMNQRDIDLVISDFVAAAKRAVAIGYDVIEIHAAHGYLLHEFMSPISNHRNDDYGGIIDHRIKMTLECVSTIREVVPDSIALFVRISTVDYLPNGWDIEQSIYLAKKLKNMGVDLIDCSSGAIAPGEQIPIGLGYQVPYAASIRQGANIPTGAVGLITTATQAEEILKSESADMIFLGRPFLRDPYFALHAAQELDNDNKYPNQYIRGFYQKKQ